MLLKKTNSSDSLKQPSINSEENNDLTGKLTRSNTAKVTKHFMMQNFILVTSDRSKCLSHPLIIRSILNNVT